MTAELIGAAAPARTTDYRPPSLLSVYRVRAVVELKTFAREREAVVFTFAFPVLLLVIFGAVFGRQDVDGGVKFAQVFVAGMIAAGLFASSFQNLGIAIPIERDSGALKRLVGRHGFGADDLDRLLRGDVLVDLLNVVRQGVRASHVPR